MSKRDPTDVSVPPAPKRRRWLLGCGLLVLLLFAACGGLYGYFVYRTDKDVREAEAEANRLEPDGWRLEEGWLRRKYTTDGWLTTLALVNTVGYLAEAAWHHPDLSVTWGKVWVKLKTHSEGGITDKDFALAHKIEEVVLWRPGPGGPLEGTPNKFVQAKK